MATFQAVTKRVVDVLNQLSGWLLLIAIIWLCWGLARVLWLVLAPPQSPQLPLMPIQVKQAPKLNASAALTIFENQTPKPTQSNTPPPQVKLIGVMLATPNDASSAILQVEGQVANYRIGDIIEPSKFKLIDVSWNQAVIEAQSGQQIMLDMPARMELDQGGFSANAAGSGSIGNRRLPPVPRAGANAAAAQSLANKPPNSMPNTNDNRSNNNTNNGNSTNVDTNNSETATVESALDTAIDELKQNPASYSSGMGVMATGNGYQVTDAMPANIRNKLGLQSGDSVLSVNGQNVGSNPAGDADLLNQVKQSGQATIEVKRGDQVITVRQQF